MSIPLTVSIIADIQTEITATQTMIAEYEMTLSDLAEMDCASDPEAFSAALARCQNNTDNSTRKSSRD